MLFTISDIGGQVRSLVGAVDQTEAETCVDVEFRALFQQFTWNLARTNLELHTPAAKQAGTVSVTQGDVHVAGAGTAFDATDVGKALRLPDGQVYLVASFTDPQQLTLTTPYTGATQPGAAYTLVQNRYTLPEGVSRILALGAETLGSMRERSFFEINLLDPGRVAVGDPKVWLPLDDTQEGLHVIELWPPPLTVRTYYYVGLVQDEGENVERFVTNLSTLLLDLACKRACQVAYGATREEHWMTLMKVYADQAMQQLISVRNMDRKRFTIRGR